MNLNVRLEVFKKHWSHAVKIMNKEKLSYDEAEPVVYYLEQMVALLFNDNTLGGMVYENGAFSELSVEKLNEAIKEAENQECIERDSIYLYCLEQDLFNKIHNWSSRCMGEILEKLKRQQLMMYSAVVEQGQTALLQNNGILQPLLRLLREYSLRSSRQLEITLVHLLHVFSIRISNDNALYQKCSDINVSSPNQSPQIVDHLIYPLVPFLHREPPLGAQARDAVLLQLTVTRHEQNIATCIALQSDFCPVLATGLSALYSALPRRLPELWYNTTLKMGQLDDGDVAKIEELKQFLDYLTFCCQVCQVTHPLIREAVLHYIYNGFLLPVLGASLNQNSMEEVTTATIYLELFIRSISDQGIQKAFLCFLIAESHDEYRILNSLINRINSNSGLAVASLSLLNTLLQFRCEDIMYELIFKYLIPIGHLSQSRESQRMSSKFLEDAICNFLNLRIPEINSKKTISPEYLEYARSQIDKFQISLENNWHFDYNGASPSIEYLSTVQKRCSVMNYSQNAENGDGGMYANKMMARPFHGFLDHYSQLLEMRDLYKHQPHNSMPFNGDQDQGENGSMYGGSISGFTTPIVPFSPAVSHRSTADTIVSMMKFEENDLQLDRCLQKLRYPSQEDLLQQRSRYMLSYAPVYCDSSVSGDSASVDGSSVIVNGNGNAENRHHKGFDMVRPVSPDDDDEDDDDDDESNPRTNVDIDDSGISMDELDKIASCDQIDQFIAELDHISIDEKSMRGCQFSLDQVLQTLNELNEASQSQDNSQQQQLEYQQSGGEIPIPGDGQRLVGHHRSSPVSIKSAFTLEDDDEMMMLRYGGGESIDMAHPQNNSSETRQFQLTSQHSTNTNLGNFLYSLMDRLENLTNNPIQINLALTAIVTSLLSYPHPLLRNHLLNTVINDTNDHKTLFSVMITIRQRLMDATTKLNISKNDDQYFGNILKNCFVLFDKRQQLVINSNDSKENNFDENSRNPDAFQKKCDEIFIPVMNYSLHSKVTTNRKSIQKRQFNFLQFFNQKSHSTDSSSGSSQKNSPVSSTPKPETTRAYQLGYTTIIFDALCHEISAFANEHAMFLMPTKLFS